MLGFEPSLDTDAAVAISMLEASLLMVGCAVLGPLVVMPFAWLPGRLLAFASGITGEIARWNALRLPQRTASIVAPMILSIGFASLMFCLLAIVQDATTQQTAARVQADLVVVPTNGGLPLGVTSAINRIPGVMATSVMLPANSLLVDAHSGGFVDLDGDARAAGVTEQINGLGNVGYQLQTVTRAEYVAGMHQSLVSGAWAIYLIIGSAAGLAGLAIVNTMIMSMGQRARELILACSEQQRDRCC
ncbi:MAG TPA: hypothetical protein VF201_12350 [Nitrolancea sp.]